MRISWLDISEKIKHELRQQKEEGNDVDELTQQWENTINLGLSEPEFKEKAELFYKQLENKHPVVIDDKNEPSAWDEIVKQCGIKKDKLPSLSASFIENRILGGWLGRCAGCLLGKPIEKIPRSGIKELLSSNNTWPISNYISGMGIPSSLLIKYPWNKHSGKESLKENIICMTEDDDINYPMLNLITFEKYGEEFTTENIAQTWMENLPVLSTFTAERVAYNNILNGIFPPKSSTIRNPYREWIGAQIRADFWGWISPQQPARAAEIAWRDARLSHVRNGIYGEIFVAAAIAACFKYENVVDVINEALTFVPSQSRFAEAISFVLSIPILKQPWDFTVDMLYEKFGHYHWVHTINNAALVAAALISSKGDFETAICNTVMGGWDTDSNGATVGSIIGTMLGANKLPEKWISPLNNKVRTSLKGLDNSNISELAKRTVILSKNIPNS
ncbi:MAG: ADP-ribosylglycohydrolase family protein [Ignavibacteriaceae bacterium]|nr:ADP-ribosylglycohydrolase family protein [Ignavibacteriaceae bacterium]